MSTQYTTAMLLPYPATGDSSWDIPYKDTFLVLDTISPIRDLAVIPAERPSASLNVAVRSGSFISSSGAIVSYAGTNSYTLSTGTTKIWLTDAGVLTTGAAYPATTYVPLATVTAGASTITTVTDDRFRPQPVIAASTSTSDLKDVLVARGFIADSGASPLNLDSGALTCGTITASGVFVAAASTTSAASIRIAQGTAPTSPSEGDIWNDSTQKALRTRLASLTSAVNTTMFVATASATIANTTTETTLFGSGSGTTTLPASLLAVGKSLRLRLSGVVSTDPSAGSLTIRAKLGSTTIVASSAVTPSNSLTNVAWVLDVDLTCRTIGASGTVIGQGMMQIADSTGRVIGLAATAAVTVDTTASQAVNVTAQWGAASASNTITCSNAAIILLN